MDHRAGAQEVTAGTVKLRFTRESYSRWREAHLQKLSGWNVVEADSHQCGEILNWGKKERER